MGKYWYEKTRRSSTFNVTGYVKRIYNQHARVYTFLDCSQFIMYRDGGKAWRDSNGFMLARRM